MGRGNAENLRWLKLGENALIKAGWYGIFVKNHKLCHLGFSPLNGRTQVLNN
jgi:hypothetical protein